MTSEQVFGILRAIIATGGGILATKGYIDADTANAIVGGCMSVVTGVWSVLAKK